MDFQKHIRNKSLPRPSPLGTSRDPARPGPPPRPYEPSPSFLGGPLSKPSYELSSYQDHEMPRPHGYSFSSPYLRDSALSRSPYASLRADATNGYPSQSGSPVLLHRHVNDGGLKDHNGVVYRDGRDILVVFLFLCFRSRSLAFSHLPFVFSFFFFFSSFSFFIG